MPVHTDHKSLSAASVLLSLTVCLTLLSALPAGAQDSEGAGESATDAATYQAHQRKLVQEIRRINLGLVTPELLAEYGKVKQKYQGILNNGAPARAELEILRTGLKYQIYVLSDSDIQSDPATLATEFQTVVGRLNRAGNGIFNKDAQKRFRQTLCDEAAKLIEDLLKSNLVARSLGLQLLLELEVVRGGGGARIQMHESIHQVYERVLTSAEEADAVKAGAAYCARKYLEKANAYPQVQIALASALASELRRPFTEMAYQDTLAAALERVATPRDVVGEMKPVHVEVAVEVLRDRSRSLSVRSRCARVLGRAGYDNGMNLDVMSWLVAELTLEVGLKFNVQDTKDEPKWQRSGWYLYTAFHHEDRKEVSGQAPLMPKGFLNRDSKSAVVRGAYEASVDIMAQLMFGRKSISSTEFNDLETWLKANKPDELKYDRNCAPLPDTTPPEADSAVDN